APATKHQKRLLERVAFFVSGEKVLLKQWHGIFHETLHGLLSPSLCKLCSIATLYDQWPLSPHPVIRVNICNYFVHRDW
ncbi:hypothetical protein, partial [Pseudomonas pergaminensis]